MKIPISRNDKRILARSIYYFNDLYNFIFKKLFGNLIDYKIRKGSHLANNQESIKNANSSQSAWLLNVKRGLILSIQIINKFKLKKLSDSCWIDVGCGSGLASIYAQSKFNIKKQYLFDFDKRNVEITYSNYQKAKSSILGKISKIIIPKIVEADAASCIIPFKKNKLSIIYMYNPFEINIIRKFIKNNYDLIKNGCIIIYLNDIYRKEIINLLKDYIKEYERNDFFQISVFYFN